MRRPRTPPRRYGFTMVELLVVILVLAILLGLLIPAVMRAIGSAKDAAVAAEINQMAQALADFKDRYGTYPPSRIIVSETGNYSSSGPRNIGTYANSILAARSISALRRIFPKMMLSTTGPVPGIPGIFYDFNGNGSVTQAPDPAYILEGPDCLVFFLGGIPLQTANGWGMTGFGTNPSNPMASAVPYPPTMTVPTYPYSSNRTPPLFEFNNGRLDDNIPVSASGNGSQNGIPEYYDSLTSHATGSLDGFYAYFSSYEGVGYDPGDCDSAVQEQDDQGNAEYGAFMTNNIAGAPSSVRNDFIKSPPPNPYANDTPIPQASNGSVDTNPSTMYRPRAYQNPQTFQIISCGRDRQWGIGGQYISNVPSGRLPLINPTNLNASYGGSQTTTATFAITGAMDPNVRLREQDNITNFSSGRLE